MSRSQRPALQGWASLMVVALLVSSLGAYVAPTPVFAQDDGEAAATEEGTPAEAPVEGETATETTDDIGTESFLSWMIRASGIFGVVLLLLSFIMVAVIMMNILQVRRDNLLPPAFIEAFEQKLAAKDYQGAYETARSDDSFIARVLAAGLGKLNRGYQEAIEGMQEVGEEESMTMEHRLSYLALIGSIAPMIGLMGTVYGMIDSFSEIATSPVQPKPKDLADGIATALFTTLEGLTVAIPALIAYSLLRNRVSRFVLEVGMVSEGLMSRFSTVGKQKSGGAAVATAPATPAEE
ncbi:MAG: MotA/TolQ/ExbB proton channel family protein [Maioricimonas sp. JB049]